MQPIKFCKMHGLGNDFVVIDCIHQTLDLKKFPIKQLANRHMGIGFDQLLLIEKSKQADFACRIFNSDGSEAEQCGNGMRCVARFVHEEKLTAKKSFSIATKAGVVNVLIHDYDTIQVSMGIPIFQPKLNTAAVELSALSMGNPHAILQVKSVKEAPVLELGPTIAMHSAFPHGVNVGFMEVVNRQHIRLRTFERGAGETLACGSNACASVAAGIKNGLLDRKVKVEPTLGSLWVEWPDDQQVMLLTGPAVKVFVGDI